MEVWTPEAQVRGYLRVFVAGRAGAGPFNNELVIGDAPEPFTGQVLGLRY